MTGIEADGTVVKGERRSENALLRSVNNRWTPALCSGGWTPVSDFFLENYHALPRPIKTAEAMLVIHIVRHKWTQEKPFPSLKRLAKRMGISATAVRNHLRSLDKKGYVKRVPRSGFSNAFDLEPLFRALEELKNSLPRERNPANQEAVLGEIKH